MAIWCVVSIIFSLANSNFKQNIGETGHSYSAINTTLPSTNTTLVSARVNNVIDGDTIDVVFEDNSTSRVRLIGVDTPELSSTNSVIISQAKKAKQFTYEQLFNANVELEYDIEKTDKYGRLLAYVWINNSLFNNMLVKNGYAYISTYPPNIKYVDTFTSSQSYAQEKCLGLWYTSNNSSQETKIYYYISAGGSDKFHSMSCEWADMINRDFANFYTTRDEAISKGLRPCRVCNP